MSAESAAQVADDKPKWTMDAVAEDVCFVQKDGFDVIRICKMDVSGYGYESDKDYRPVTEEEFQWVLDRFHAGLCPEACKVDVTGRSAQNKES